VTTGSKNGRKKSIIYIYNYRHYAPGGQSTLVCPSARPQHNRVVPISLSRAGHLISIWIIGNAGRDWREKWSKTAYSSRLFTAKLPGARIRPTENGRKRTKKVTNRTNRPGTPELLFPRRADGRDRRYKICTRAFRRAAIDSGAVEINESVRFISAAKRKTKQRYMAM